MATGTRGASGTCGAWGTSGYAKREDEQPEPVIYERSNCFYVQGDPGKPINDLSDITAIQKIYDYGSSNQKYGIKVRWAGNKSNYDYFWYTHLHERDTDFSRLQERLDKINCFKTQKGGLSKMFKTAKEYFINHRDILMTIGLAMLVDHFFFNGAFAEKIKGLVNGLIHKAEKSMEA